MVTTMFIFFLITGTAAVLSNSTFKGTVINYLFIVYIYTYLSRSKTIKNIIMLSVCNISVSNIKIAIRSLRFV